MQFIIFIFLHVSILYNINEVFDNLIFKKFHIIFDELYKVESHRL